MRNTTTILAIALTLTALSFPPVATADHCSNFLGSRDWVCHADPNVDAEYTCVTDCETREFYMVDDGPRPGIWLVRCEVDLPIVGPATVPQVIAGDEPDCDLGEYDSTVTALVPADPDGGIQDGELLVTLTWGDCVLEFTLLVYAFGAEDHSQSVPCAIIE